MGIFRAAAIGSGATAAWLLAVTAAMPAAAEDGAFRCPLPGTVLDTTAGRLTVGARDGFWCQTGPSRRRYAAFWENDTRPSIPDLVAIWPLAVGKSAQSRRDGANRWRSYGGSDAAQDVEETEIMRVVRREAVTVPAGTFDAFVIEYDWHAERGPVVSQGPYTNMNAPRVPVSKNRRTFWWAPSLGYSVKFQFQAFEGSNQGPPNWELVSVTPP